MLKRASVAVAVLMLLVPCMGAKPKYRSPAAERKFKEKVAQDEAAKKEIEDKLRAKIAKSPEADTVRAWLKANTHDGKFTEVQWGTQIITLDWARAYAMHKGDANETFSIDMKKRQAKQADSYVLLVFRTPNKFGVEMKRI